MSKTKIMKELDDLLKNNEKKYYIDGILNKARVIEDLYNYDPELIVLLSENEVVQNHFVLEINDNKILKINNLIEIFEMNEYWDDSYTAYENKIGLTSSGSFLSDSKDIVLDFPYKDTILKASMSKEERQKKDLLPEEPFLNEIIAREEIDTLLDKKILIDTTKYSDKGVQKVKRFSEEENLILKGNNLIALHALKERYAGRVKLIYIDPPYNRQSSDDSFMYNDKFTHSSWLIFMKNRLEVAKELLSNDGFVVIQTDDSEQAYLKVLMDEVFGRTNYKNTVSILFKNIAGASGGGEDKRLKKNIEYLTIYSKNYEMATFNDIYKKTEIGELVEQMRNDGVSWKYTSVLVDPGKEKYMGSTVDGSGDEIKIYKRINPIIKSISQLMKEDDITEREAYIKYGKNAFQTAMPQSSIRPRVMEEYNKLTQDPNELVSIKYVPKSGKNKGKMYEQFYRGENFRLFAWLKDVSEEIDGVLYKNEKRGTFWDYVGETKNVNKEGKVTFSNGKKPEGLLKNILNLTTQPGDLVIDFFLGSGSTAATAHKMNRQYIGIEQMDYIEELVITRLKNVINGDKSGISNEVNWQGGGSFVYAELMEKNTGYLKDILDAESPDRLKEVFNLMLEHADFDFKVDLDEFKESVWRLSLKDQKRTLVKIIDKNQLYYNYAEINDENVRDFISDSDYAFNKSFYDNTGDEDE